MCVYVYGWFFLHINGLFWYLVIFLSNLHYGEVMQNLLRFIPEAVFTTKIK